MEVLKRKKMYEAQRDAAAAQGFNVEQTAFAIDTVKDTQTTVAAMQAASQVHLLSPTAPHTLSLHSFLDPRASQTLKVEQAKIDVDDIEDMADDLSEMMDESESLCNRGPSFSFLSVGPHFQLLADHCR